MFLSSTDFPVPDGPEDGGDPALGHVEGDVLEHGVRAEGLGDPPQGDDRLAGGDPRLGVSLRRAGSARTPYGERYADRARLAP